MTTSVKMPVLAGKKITASSGVTTVERSQRFGQVMTKAFQEHDPLTFAVNRAKDARAAAHDEVNAGRAQAPKLTDEHAHCLQKIHSTALEYPCDVTARFVDENGQVCGTDTVSVLAPSMLNSSGRIVPESVITVPQSRFKVPRGCEIVSSEPNDVSFSLTSDGESHVGRTDVRVERSGTRATNTETRPYTVQALPVMVVDGVRFPAKQPWEFTTAIDTSKLSDAREELMRVITAQLAQTMPQVVVTSDSWSDDYSHVTLELSYRPREVRGDVAGLPNTVPGGEVFGLFPAGFRLSDNEADLSEDDVTRVIEASRVLTNEIARQSAAPRKQLGLKELHPHPADRDVVADLLRWCRGTALAKSTTVTHLQTQLTERIGKERCSELLYPKQLRRGDDSAQRLAAVFVRSAEKAIKNNSKSALLSEQATGVTAGIAVYEVDQFSKHYELSVSVMMHK